MLLKVADTIRSGLHGDGHGRCDVMELDLSSLESVRKFCRQYSKRSSSLGLLVCNAGLLDVMNKGR